MTRASSALHLSALAVASLALAACSDSLPSVPERSVGLVVLATQRSAAGSDVYVLRPTALFFRTNQLEPLESAKAPNLCENRPYAPRSTAVADTFPTVTYLDAGPTLSLDVGGNGATAMPATVDAFGKTYYAPAGNAPVSPFTPGDVVTLTVPGGAGTGDDVFPATAVSLTTVTPFTFDPVATTQNDPDGLKITWTPPPTLDPGVAKSGMQVSLRYALVGTGGANRELFCTLQDNGSFVIPIEFASEWFRSLPNGHEVVFTRWRGELTQAPNKFVNVISTFVVPTPVVH